MLTPDEARFCKRGKSLGTKVPKHRVIAHQWVSDTSSNLREDSPENENPGALAGATGVKCILGVMQGEDSPSQAPRARIKGTLGLKLTSRSKENPSVQDGAAGAFDSRACMALDVADPETIVTRYFWDSRSNSVEPLTAITVVLA